MWCVSHPFMGAYYQELFKSHHWKPFTLPRYHKPQTCTDLLARVIPHLSLVNVVCAPVADLASTPAANASGAPADASLAPAADALAPSVTPTTSTLSSHHFPHEVQFQYAMLKQLWQMGFEMIKIVSNKSTKGEPDIIAVRGASNFVLELLLTSRDDGVHREHILRFKTKGNYKAGDKKCIVTIGDDEDGILQKMRVMRAEQIRENALTDVEILGLMPSKAFYQYTLYKSAPHGYSMRIEQQNFQYESYSIPVDGVSRSINGRGYPAPVVDVKKLVEQTTMQRALCTINKLLTEAKEKNLRLSQMLRSRRSSNRFVCTGLQSTLKRPSPTAHFTDSVVCVCSRDRDRIRGRPRDRRRPRDRSLNRSRSRRRRDRSLRDRSR